MMPSQILSLAHDLNKYAHIVQTIEQKSIFYTPAYLLSVQKAEGYPIIIIVASVGKSVALIPFVLRRINDMALFKELDEELFDIITPFEYSGIITNAIHSDEKKVLFKELCNAVREGLNNKIVVSEFVRFDPFLTDLSSVCPDYEIRHAGANVFINLELSEEEICGRFANAARKNVKTAMRGGLKLYESDGKDVDVELFIALYYESLRQLKSKPYYFFNRAYFLSLVRECDGAKMLILRDSDGLPCAASILLYHGDTAHHHLTGYNHASLPKRPNDFMLYQLILWAKARGLKYLHLGGGSETIRNFKAKFSPLSIPYYVGSRIHNKEWYDKLCLIWKSTHPDKDNSSYFPLYREGEVE